MPSKASQLALLAQAQATIDSATATIRATAAAAEAGKLESTAGLQKALEIAARTDAMFEALYEAGRKEGVPHTPKTAMTLPAGTPLRSDDMGDALKSDAVISCDERDAWLLRAVLGLPSTKRASNSVNPPDPDAPASGTPLNASVTLRLSKAGSIDGLGVRALKQRSIRPAPAASPESAHPKLVAPTHRPGFVRCFLGALLLLPVLLLAAKRKQ